MIKVKGIEIDESEVIAIRDVTGKFNQRVVGRDLRNLYIYLRGGRRYMVSLLREDVDRLREAVGDIVVSDCSE